MKNTIVLLALIVIVLIGGISLNKYKQERVKNGQPNQDALGQMSADLGMQGSSSTSTADQFIPPQAIPDLDTLRANGSSFSDANGLYSFWYPNDYQLDTSDPAHPRVYKQGPTQTGQTEMYDGALVVFETADLQGQTMEQFLDQRVTQVTSDGTGEITSPKRAVTHNGYPGFTFRNRALSESTTLIIQKDATSNQALLLSYLVSDPDEIGFQTEVNGILSTIELHQ
jgi:hypothetical protein